MQPSNLTGDEGTSWSSLTVMLLSTWVSRALWRGPTGGGRVFKRLDRCLASPLWMERFPPAILEHLPRISSDHCPLIIDTAPNLQDRQNLFQFEEIWLHYKESWQIVREAWKPPVGGSAFRKLAACLDKARRARMGQKESKASLQRIGGGRR